MGVAGSGFLSLSLCGLTGGSGHSGVSSVTPSRLCEPRALSAQ